MRHHFPHFPRAAQRERGAVLIVALMFLVVLTLLGLSTMTTTTLEEKISGNARDYNVALQAVEATLRDAENDINKNGTSSRSTSAFAFTSACPAGLCKPAADTDQTYMTADWSSASTTTAKYGAWTSAAAIPSVATQPRYLMELLTGGAPIVGQSVPGNWVRITARGWGINSNTQVTLQTIFKANLN
jgi:type IV pilus assembly protein PilX